MNDPDTIPLNILKDIQSRILRIEAGLAAMLSSMPKPLSETDRQWLAAWLERSKNDR
jgi:DNA-binding transcriptional MocR family regulator